MRRSSQVVGVPGTVAGWNWRMKHFGKLPWKQLVGPAISWRPRAFRWSRGRANSLNDWSVATPDHPELRAVFGKSGGTAWRAGDRLVQPDLATTLRQIADNGPDAFYHRPIADLIVAEMKSGGGLITQG